MFVSIKRPGPGIWKKSLLNDQYYVFFSNSRSLEQPGAIIETLEYVVQQSKFLRHALNHGLWTRHESYFSNNLAGWAGWKNKL